MAAILEELLRQVDPKLFTVARRAADAPLHRPLAIHRGDEAGQLQFVAGYGTVGGNGDLATAFTAPEEGTLSAHRIAGGRVVEKVDGGHHLLVVETTLDAER